MPSSHLIFYHPLLLLPSVFPSIRISGSFQMSQSFTSGSLSIGTSASASVLPMNIQSWFPLILTGLISMWSKGLLRVFSNTTVQKNQFFSAPPSLWPHSHNSTWLLGKPEFWLYKPFFGKVMSLLFNMLSRLFTAFFQGVSHEIKRRLLLGRKVMTNLDSILKSRDMTLPTKVRLVKAMVFPVVMYGYESWTIKTAEC